MKKSLGARMLIYPAPVWCVGTYDADGEPNVMTASWAGICCSRPPCVTVSLRQATYTYDNIMRGKVYTLSVPSVKYYKEADFFGLASGRDTDKFKATGLTPEMGEHVDAPYVGEFPMILECKVVHHHELGLHTHFVGEIVDVKVDDEVLDDSGRPDVAKVQPFVFIPDVRDYHTVTSRLGTAFKDGRQFKERNEE